MGLKKNWWWDKEDWDKRIQEEGIRIYSHDIPKLNSTEMVEILNLVGVRAHRGMPIETLRDVLTKLSNDVEVEPLQHPLDPKRDTIVRFLEINWNKLRDQFLSHCHGNCYLHHDIEVVACYRASKKFFEKKYEEE